MVTFSSRAAPGADAGSGATALGRTATMGVPARTRDWTMIAPPKIDCSATRPSSRPTASVITPEPVLIASRPATSRPSAVLATRTAAGDFFATRQANSPALGAPTDSSDSESSATYTAPAPNSPTPAAPPPAPAPGPAADG